MDKEFIPYELEEWRDVLGFEGKYQISNKGSVRSLNYRGQKGNIKIMKPALSNKGYYMLPLCKNGKQKSYCIHALVAESFVDKPENFKGRLTVNHKDGIRTNNYYENLEWCSYSENNRHSYQVLCKVSGMKNKSGSLNVNSIPVILECVKTSKKQTFESMTSASKYLKVSVSALTIAMKENRPCRGYTVVKQ